MNVLIMLSKLNMSSKLHTGWGGGVVRYIGDGGGGEWGQIFIPMLKQVPYVLMSTFICLSSRNNFITYLPTELLNLPKLKTFEAQDNPLVSPPPETVKQGLRSILDYLRKRKGRRNLFSDFTPWFSANDIPHTLEVPTLLELSIK